MKDLSIRVRHIFARYLLIAIGFVSLYTAIIWYFDYKLGILHIKEDLLQYWFPLGLLLILLLIFLRRQVRILRIGRYNDDHFFYLVIAAFSILAPTIVSQKYLEQADTELIKVENVSDIERARNSDCYQVAQLYTMKEMSGVYWTSRTTGKYNEDLHFYAYFVVPVSDQPDEFSPVAHRYWLGIKYTERYSNRSSEYTKNQDWIAFQEDCLKKFNLNDCKSFQYLQGIAYNDDYDGYIEAVKTRQFNADEDYLVILEPVNDAYVNDSNKKLAWVFGSFLIGSFVFFLLLLIPSIDREEYKRYIKNKPIRKDGFKEMLDFMVPSGNHFSGAILVNLNILIFVIMVFSGISIVSPSGKELLEFGALRRSEVMNGEYWRLLSSVFVHGGLMHLFMNLFGIGITCFLIEPVLGRWKTFLIYLVSGIGASITSILYHEIISVGASGAIFGMMGTMLALLLTKRDRDFGGSYFFILLFYGGVSLLFGLLGGVDNAAHIGGLITGFLISLLIILINYDTIEKKPMTATVRKKEQEPGSE
ncbi:Rhomboid family protein [anaerobic digester metagenome]